MSEYGPLTANHSDTTTVAEDDEPDDPDSRQHSGSMTPDAPLSPLWLKVGSVASNGISLQLTLRRQLRKRQLGRFPASPSAGHKAKY